MALSDHGSSGGRRYVGLAQDLLAAIIRGEYRPGERLPSDRDVAARNGVSRPTAREAFLALELIGAIEVRHGDGAYVRGPSARVGGAANSLLDSPPRQLIETRRLIEPVVARLASRRIDKELLNSLSADLDRAAQLTDDPADLTGFVALGLRFHAQLAPACGNLLLADIVGQLVDVEQHPLWILVNQQAMSSAHARRQQLIEHRAILAHIASGEADAAEQAMYSHLEALDSAIFFPTDGSAGEPTDLAGQTAADR